MRVIFDKAARAELDDARRYYAGIHPTIAARFLDEVRHGVGCIAETPQAWPPYWDTTRRYLLKNFPFHIIYHVSRRGILIAAIAHEKRDPAYWRHRIGRREN